MEGLLTITGIKSRCTKQLLTQRNEFINPEILNLSFRQEQRSRMHEPVLLGIPIPGTATTSIWITGDSQPHALGMKSYLGKTSGRTLINLNRYRTCKQRSPKKPRTQRLRNRLRFQRWRCNVYLFF